MQRRELGDGRKIGRGGARQAFEVCPALDRWIRGLAHRPSALALPSPPLVLPATFSGLRPSALHHSANFALYDFLNFRKLAEFALQADSFSLHYGWEKGENTLCYDLAFRRFEGFYCFLALVNTAGTNFFVPAATFIARSAVRKADEIR